MRRSVLPNSNVSDRDAASSTPVFLFSDRVLDAFPHAPYPSVCRQVNLHVVDTPDQLLLSLVMRLHLPPDAH
jgi:hypothetical protein